MRMIQGFLIICLLLCCCQQSHAYAAKPIKPNLRRNSMSQLPKRNEVPADQRWKLEDLFQNQALWDTEYQQVNKLIQEIAQYEGKLTNAATVKQCFELEDKLSLHTERLYVYANMRHHEDMAAPSYMALSDKAKKLSVQVGEATSFITPEILSLTEEQLRSFIADPGLEAFKFTLTEMLRQKPHVLSKPEEALMAQVGNMSQAPNTIFSMLNNADMKFPLVKNEHGEEIELTHGRYIQFLESSDRDVRRNAFQAMYATYSKQKNTLAATLSANVTKNIFYARARKYPSVLEM